MESKEKLLSSIHPRSHSNKIICGDCKNTELFHIEYIAKVVASLVDGEFKINVKTEPSIHNAKYSCLLCGSEKILTLNQYVHDHELYCLNNKPYDECPECQEIVKYERYEYISQCMDCVNGFEGEVTDAFCVGCEREPIRKLMGIELKHIENNLVRFKHDRQFNTSG